MTERSFEKIVLLGIRAILTRAKPGLYCYLESHFEDSYRLDFNAFQITLEDANLITRVWCDSEYQQGIAAELADPIGYDRFIADVTAVVRSSNQDLAARRILLGWVSKDEFLASLEQT
jgi:hypothetical protein